jgi:hypothetical protein
VSSDNTIRNVVYYSHQGQEQQENSQMLIDAASRERAGPGAHWATQRTWRWRLAHCPSPATVPGH